MRIAIISFDQEFSKQLKDQLEPDNEVRVYIDSLGMLRDLKEFHPDIIVYDASAGEFAIDDLKFLMTRDKLENNEFKIFISETDPINVDELPKNIKKEIYTKDKKGIDKFISKMKIAGFQTEDFEDTLLGGDEGGLDTSSLLLEEPSKTKDKSPEEDILMQTPEDIEELLMGGGDFLEEKKEEPKPKKEEKKEEPPKAKETAESKIPSNEIFEEDIPIEDIESILGELGIEEPAPAKKEEKKEEKKEVEPAIEQPKQEKKKKASPEDFLAEFEDFFSLDTTKRKKKAEEPKKVEEKKEEKPEVEFSPQDIEELLTETPEPKQEVSKEIFTPEIVKTPKATGDISKITASAGAIKIELTLSQEELKQLIVNATVEKMVDELKKDETLKELIQDVQKDFIDRTEKELEGLKEVVKKEVKTRLLKKIEEDLKESIKESIKKDVMEITTKLVKQKLEQLFGGK